MALVEQLVRDYEARLSRFLPDSALSRLNRDRRADDDVLAAVVASAEEARRLTAGAFDARAGAAVIAAGYDRSFDEIEAGRMRVEDAERPVVLLLGTTVVLLGWGRLDLGGIAKGWIVDRATELLAEAGRCVVDGGGDIRVAGGPQEWSIGVGDGLAVGLSAGAVATSSVRDRRWSTASGEAHHIVAPPRGVPASGDVTTAAVVARDAATADALATAVVADEAKGLRAVAASGGEALLQRTSGAWEMTPGMARHLR
jgi:thiamine biosynthesis lipoprotein